MSFWSTICDTFDDSILLPSRTEINLILYNYYVQVMVEDEEDGATYTFACDRWLADDEDDKKIERELECTESTERKC